MSYVRPRKVNFGLTLFDFIIIAYRERLLQNISSELKKNLTLVKKQIRIKRNLSRDKGFSAFRFIMSREIYIRSE